MIEIDYHDNEARLFLNKTFYKKVDNIGTPLKNWDISINHGIKTGKNEAFIISEEKRNELISDDPKSTEIKFGITSAISSVKYRLSARE